MKRYSLREQNKHINTGLIAAALCFSSTSIKHNINQQACLTLIPASTMFFAVTYKESHYKWDSFINHVCVCVCLFCILWKINYILGRSCTAIPRCTHETHPDFNYMLNTQNELFSRHTALYLKEKGGIFYLSPRLHHWVHSGTLWTEPSVAWRCLQEHIAVDCQRDAKRKRVEIWSYFEGLGVQIHKESLLMQSEYGVPTCTGNHLSPLSLWPCWEGEGVSGFYWWILKPKVQQHVKWFQRPILTQYYQE